MSRGVKELLKASNRGRHQSRYHTDSFDQHALGPHSSNGQSNLQLDPPLSSFPNTRQSSIPSVHAYSTPTRHRTVSSASILSWITFEN